MRTPATRKWTSVFLLMLILTGCGVLPARAPAVAPQPHMHLTPGDDVTIRGTINSIDRTATTTDGDGIIGLQLDTGQTVTVLVPAGERQCLADVAIFPALKAQDSISVAGAVRTPGEILVCDSAQHHIRYQ